MILSPEILWLNIQRSYQLQLFKEKKKKLYVTSYLSLSSANRLSFLSQLFYEGQTHKIFII